MSDAFVCAYSRPTYICYLVTLDSPLWWGGLQNTGSTHSYTSHLYWFFLTLVLHVARVRFLNHITLILFLKNSPHYLTGKTWQPIWNLTPDKCKVKGEIDSTKYQSSPKMSANSMWDVWRGRERERERGMGVACWWFSAGTSTQTV